MKTICLNFFSPYIKTWKTLDIFFLKIVFNIAIYTLKQKKIHTRSLISFYARNARMEMMRWLHTHTVSGGMWTWKWVNTVTLFSWGVQVSQGGKCAPFGKSWTGWGEFDGGHEEVIPRVCLLWLLQQIFITFTNEEWGWLRYEQVLLHHAVHGNHLTGIALKIFCAVVSVTRERWSNC